MLWQGWQNSRNAPPLIWGVGQTEVRSGPDAAGCQGTLAGQHSQGRTAAPGRPSTSPASTRGSRSAGRRGARSRRWRYERKREAVHRAAPAWRALRGVGGSRLRSGVRWRQEFADSPSVTKGPAGLACLPRCWSRSRVRGLDSANSVWSACAPRARPGFTGHPRNAHEAVQQPDAADGAGLRQKLLRQGRQNGRNAPPLIWGVGRTG